GVLERRRLSRERDRILKGPVRLPRRGPQLLVEDTGDRVYVAGLRCRAAPVEGGKVRKGAVGAGTVTALQSAEPRDEGVRRYGSRTRAGQVETPLQARAVPSLGIHDVVGAHLRQQGEAPPRGPVRVPAHQLEVSQRFPVPALLQKPVAQPMGVM